MPPLCLARQPYQMTLRFAMFICLLRDVCLIASSALCTSKEASVAWGHPQNRSPPPPH
jgi:hypothetical protein